MNDLCRKVDAYIVLENHINQEVTTEGIAYPGDEGTGAGVVLGGNSATYLTLYSPDYYVPNANPSLRISKDYYIQNAGTTGMDYKNIYRAPYTIGGNKNNGKTTFVNM